MSKKIMDVSQKEDLQTVVKAQHSNQKKKRRIILIAFSLILLAVIFILVLLVITVIKQFTAVPLEENTFYTAVYQNKPVLFYKYDGMLKDLKPIGQYDGEYYSYSDAQSPQKMNQMLNVQYIDFHKLQNPKKLFSFDRYATLINVKFNPDKSYMFMSFIGGTEDSINYIYQVNLTTSAAKKVWEHTLRSGNPPLNEGEAYITQFIPDRFVVFDIIQENPPPDAKPQGTVVLNQQTSAIKSLGSAGDTQINLTNNTISYRTIGKTLVPCEGKHDPVCFAGDTHKYGYEPIGKPQIQPLP